MTDNAPAKSRGRPAIPLSWTRLISVCHDDLGASSIYPIATDKLVAAGLPVVPRTRRQAPWTPYFWPKDFTRSHKDMTFENYQLSKARMLKYGKLLTKERKKIRDRALDMEQV